MDGKEPLMIDVMTKTICYVKRQIMYFFYMILKYIRLKSNKASQLGKTLFIVSGRANPTSVEGKKMIEFLYKIKEIVNNDKDAHNYMKIIYVPNYGVTWCERFVSSCDLSQHISMPGSEVNFHYNSTAERHFNHEVHYERRVDSG